MSEETRLRNRNILIIAVIFSILLVWFLHSKEIIMIGDYKCWGRALDLSKEYEAKGYETRMVFGKIRDYHTAMEFRKSSTDKWKRYDWNELKAMQTEFCLNWKIAEAVGNDYFALKEAARITHSECIGEVEG